MLRLANSMDIKVTDEMESYLSIVNGGQDTSAESPTEALAIPTRPARSRRRRLSPDEERDIARLYADTSTPTSEIRERFRIGESSLYRVVQRHGVALRGRSASSSKPSLPRALVPAAQGRRSTKAVERSAGGPDRRVPAAQGNTSLASSRTGGGAQQRFRIQFQGESVVEATDIRDALRQAEELGAIEITAVARVEQ
jgi:transposase-like protein